MKGFGDQERAQAQLCKAEDTGKSLRRVNNRTPGRAVKKKRKRQSDGKAEGKRAKSDFLEVEPRNGDLAGNKVKEKSEIMKPGTKFRVQKLDDMFASVKRPELVKHEHDKIKKRSAGTPTMKQASIIDLTSPEPVKQNMSFLKNVAKTGSFGALKVKKQSSIVTAGKLTQKNGKMTKKPKKSRSVSSDGVVFVGELKKAGYGSSSPAKVTCPQVKKVVCDLRPLPGGLRLWTEKHEPRCSGDVVGNSADVEKLVSWLQEWKKRWEKEQEEILKQENRDTSKNKGDDSDSDFELDNDDRAVLKKDDDSFSKVGVIIGPTGCGKTSTVYACAKELQFKVFEMNASSQRSSKQILSRLHEATQSHQVSKVNNGFNFFTVKDSSKKLEGNSLILFEDADILFDEDKHFWSAVHTLASDTKRPIILTTSDSSVLSNLEKKYEKFLFGPPAIDKQLACLRSIGEKEGSVISEENFVNLKMTSRVLGCDIRKSIHAFHFWGAGESVASSTNNEAITETVKKAKKPKRRRRSRGKLKQGSDENPTKNSEVLSEKAKFALDDVFMKSCGIYDVLSRLQTSSSLNCESSEQSRTRNSSLKKIFTERKSSEILEIMEEAISSLILSKLPPIIKINWLTLLPCFNSVPAFSVGKTPLPIPVPLSAPDLNMEFSYECTYDEVPTPVSQEPADFLIEEDSVDISYESKPNLFPCMPRNPSEKIRNSASNSVKNKLDLHTLSNLSFMADECCFVDRMESSLSRNGNSGPTFNPSLNCARCKIKDGLSDVSPYEAEFTHQTLATASEIQASIQVRSLSQCCENLTKISTDCPTPSCSAFEELSLRLPHEGKTRRNNQYICRSLQSRFVGGNSTATRAFTMDYLPAIRSICRSENVRKESKKKRRFLHYFDTIRVFPKPAEMSRLQNDFKEISDIK